MPTVGWLKDNSAIPPRARLSSDNRTLVITSVEISDEGTYTCEVGNRAGNASSTALVEVTGVMQSSYTLSLAPFIVV